MSITSDALICVQHSRLLYGGTNTLGRIDYMNIAHAIHIGGREVILGHLTQSVCLHMSLVNAIKGLERRSRWASL